MKKILLFLLLVFPIVAKAQLELPFPIKLVNSSPVDFWYFESDGTPYDNTGEVTTQVLSAIRYIGQTFNVNGVEYWFKDGITDGDLIAKGGGSVDTTAFIKTQGTSVLTADVNVLSGDAPRFIRFGDQTSDSLASFQAYARHPTSGNFSYLSAYSNSGGRAFYSAVGKLGEGSASIFNGGAAYGPASFQYQSFSNANGSIFFIMNADSLSEAGLQFDDQRAVPLGLTYKDNYASNFVDRSLVDKHYVDSVATGGGGGGADALGTYLVQTATNAPANAQIMGSLATGIVKNTTTTGVQSIAVAADFPTLNQNTTGNAATVTTNANLTGDVTSTGNATAIASGVIVNADINASAAIGATKLIDGSITDTELGYINTLSSNAQTQITAREVLTNKATDLSTFNSTLYPTTASLFARRDVTGTDAIVQADNGKTIYFNSGSPFNFTIDALTTNSSVYFYNKGSATVTFVDGSGVTSTGVTSLAAGESGGIIYESSTTPIILGTPSGGGGGLTVGTSTITSGTNTKVLYNNSGVLGEYTVSGTGNVALTTSPTFTTPALGTPSALVGTNITGTATGLTSGITNALKSATTTVDVSAATAPTSGQVLTATSGTAATWQTPASASGAWLLTGTSTLTGNVNIAQAGFSTTFSGIGKVTFSPTSGSAGINAGSYAGNPSPNSNGDLWYNSTDSYFAGTVSGNPRIIMFATLTPANNYIPYYTIGTRGITSSSSSLQFNGTSFMVGAGTLSGTIRTLIRGIGTGTDYSLKLETSGGTERFGFLDNGSFLIGGSAGTSGQVLTSAGSGSPPVWTDQTIQTVKVTLSSAEVLALNSSPKVLIAAPGAGKVIQIINAYLYLDYNSTTYLVATDLNISCNGYVLGTSSGFLTNASDGFGSITPNSANTNTDQVNKSLDLTTSVDPTTGNSPVYVYVTYRIITL